MKSLLKLNYPAEWLNISSLAYLCLCCTLFFSCAQIVSPGGGPQDTSPPTVVSYQPDSAALNFKSKTINITFNEYIQLKDINGQLIISPVMNKTPEVKVKGKMLTIKIEEPLRDSTTYTFNFGEAIRDITEDNHMESFQYVMSTGSYLDSLSLSGRALYAINNQSQKGTLVMLYEKLNDSIPYKERPVYFTKTRSDGTFKINNIKNGIYKVIALRDSNANYLYDMPEESIGFIPKFLNIRDNDTVNISLFSEFPPKILMKKASQIEYRHLLFTFNKPVEKIDFRSLDTIFSNQWYLEEYNKGRDSLHLWLTNIGNPDSLVLELKEKDMVLDTVAFRLIKKEEALKPRGRGNALSLQMTLNANQNSLLDLNKDLIIKFNHPVVKIAPFDIFIKEDSLLEDGYKAVFIPVDSLETGYIKQFRIRFMKTYSNNTPSHKKEFEENKKYSFTIPSGTFTDLFDLSNDSTNISFGTQLEKYYGSIKLKLYLPLDKNFYVLQLIDSKGIIVNEKRVNNSQVLDYKNMHPQKYRFKLIEDANKNGEWDTGNYLLHKQAEKVVYYPEEINVRSNWELNLEWKVDF